MPSSELPADTIQGRLRRGAWFIALVFVLVVAASFAYFRATGSTSQYKTTVTVAPPATVTNPAEALQYVGDFRAALTSDVVAHRVAAVTGLTAASYRKRISSVRNGDSAIIDVTYTSARADTKSKTIVAAAVAQTGSFLSKGRSAAQKAALAATDKDLATANKEADRANASVADFIAKNGGLDPDRAVEALQARIVDLTLQVAQDQASGNATAATTAGNEKTALATQLRTARAQAADLAPFVHAADSAQLRVDSAGKARQTALQAVSQDESAAEFAYSKVNAAASQTQTWLRKSVAIGAAIAILAALLVAWLPAWRVSRRRNQALQRRASHRAA